MRGLALLIFCLCFADLRPPRGPA